MYYLDLYADTLTGSRTQLLCAFIWRILSAVGALALLFYVLPVFRLQRAWRFDEPGHRVVVAFFRCAVIWMKPCNPAAGDGACWCWESVGWDNRSGAGSSRIRGGYELAGFVTAGT